MKRFLLSFIFALCIFAFYNTCKAEACVAPVKTGSEADVVLYDAEDLAMQYCKVDIRPASGYFAVTAEIAVKNNGDDADVMFGIPYWFYNGLSASSGVSVNYKGSSLKVDRLNAVRNAELEEEQAYYSSYYCWTANIEAGETAYMYATFTVTTRQYENNTQCIDLPLDVLKYWAKDSGVAEITVDGPAVKIYSYDRTPSITPSYVSEDGALIWERNIALYNANLIVYHNIDNSVIAKYFTNNYTSGLQKEAAELFRTRQYAAAIAFIDANDLSQDKNFAFMKMVCLEKLGIKAEALEILKTIYTDSICFAADSRYDISEYVSKRMLYDYYSSVSGASEALLEAKRSILSDGIKALTDSRSSVFLTWARSEIKEVETAIVGINDEYVEMDLRKGNLTFLAWVKEISDPVIITVGIVMIVVVIFCLTGMFTGSKKDKKEKTRNIKR